MKEIGGYLEFEKPTGAREYYPGSQKYTLLHSLRLLSESTGCRFYVLILSLSDSLTGCRTGAGITLIRYSIGRDFRPDRFHSSCRRPLSEMNGFYP